MLGEEEGSSWGWGFQCLCRSLGWDSAWLTLALVLSTFSWFVDGFVLCQRRLVLCRRLVLYRWLVLYQRSAIGLCSTNGLCFINTACASADGLCFVVYKRFVLYRRLVIASLCFIDGLCFIDIGDGCVCTVAGQLVAVDGCRCCFDNINSYVCKSFG